MSKRPDPLASFPFKLTLSNRGNPDHGQNPYQTIFLAPIDQVVGADSLEHASALARAYIDDNGLGSGSWTGGKVVDQTGATVARVAYNGRVFAPDNGAALGDVLYEPVFRPRERDAG